MPHQDASVRRRPHLRGRLARFAARPDAVALLSAGMLFLVGAQIALVHTVPSWANDEPAHLGYVAALAAGDLPTIETDIVDDPDRFPGTAGEILGHDEEHGDIWTANHPPLFHLAMVPVWWALSDVNQSGMVITMRLANTLGFAVWLYLVAALARELVPRRPAVAALAVVVAAAPTLVMRSAFLLTDGLASASAVLLLLMTVRMLRGEVTPRRVVLATAAGTVAAGTRAQGVLVVALCALALVAVLGWRWRSARSGLARSAAIGALVGGVPAAAFGWFYLRNLRLYGDLTGQGALLEKFDRDPVAGWGPLVDVPGVNESTLATAVVVVAAVVLVPVALVGSVRRHGVRLDAAWVLLGVQALLTLQSVVAFLRAGGYFHDRYLMQSMPLLATAVAVGMLEVGRWVRAPRAGTPAAERRDWWVTSAWSAVLLVWLAGATTWLADRHVYSRQESSPVDGPVPDALAVAATCLGAVIVALMVRRALAAGRSGAGRPTRVGVIGVERRGRRAVVPPDRRPPVAAARARIGTSTKS